MGAGVITNALKDKLKIPKDLSTVPTNLWSRTSTDIGLLVSAQPVVVKRKGGSPPDFKQYPIPKEAERSIQKLIDWYMSQGILKECSSPYNAPILPLKK